MVSHGTLGTCEGLQSSNPQNCSACPREAVLSMTDLSGYNRESLTMDHIGEHVPIQTSFVDFGKE
jgi:hypothetical protein